MIKERKWMNLKCNVVQVEWNKQKEWQYQGDVRERMKGLRGTELATPFHPLYTLLGPSPWGMDKKMAHWVHSFRSALTRTMCPRYPYQGSHSERLYKGKDPCVWSVWFSQMLFFMINMFFPPLICNFPI